jgi:hypothetical protein
VGCLPLLLQRPESGEWTFCGVGRAGTSTQAFGAEVGSGSVVGIISM